MRSENRTLPVSALKAYFLAARPKTWIASISPVLIGASLVPKIDPFLFGLTLLFSLLIQIGTNYANDYYDYIKGTDNLNRIGPKRAVNEGWITPSSMLRATWLVFALSLLIALPLISNAGLWSLSLAILIIALGFLYTAGPKPLGYLGLGELLVFLFFGPVATIGTIYLQTHSISTPAILASLPPGLLSCSILIANNLRDENTDRVAGKKTIIVRFGSRFGALLYTGTILVSTLVPFVLVHLFLFPIDLLSATVIFPLSLPFVKKVFTFQHPQELISVLQGSALLLFVYAFFFCIALF
jgi:1,4-dihydroxy-2-naphthoate polyprenyltransferase